MKVSKAKDPIAFSSSGHAEPNLMERSYKYSDRCSHILCLGGKLMSNILAVHGHYSSFNANGGGKKKTTEEIKRERKRLEVEIRETNNGKLNKDTSQSVEIPLYFQAVRLHRCRKRSYLVSGKKTS